MLAQCVILHVVVLSAPGHSGCREPRRALPGRHQLQLCGSREALHGYGQPLWRGEGHSSLGTCICHPQVMRVRVKLRTGSTHTAVCSTCWLYPRLRCFISAFVLLPSLSWMRWMLPWTTQTLARYRTFCHPSHSDQRKGPCYDFDRSLFD